MKTALFVVDAIDVRGGHPKPFWFAHSIMLHVDQASGMLVVGPLEGNAFDTVIIRVKASQTRVAVIHYRENIFRLELR